MKKNEFDIFLNNVQGKLAKEKFKERNFEIFDDFPFMTGQCFYVMSFRTRSIIYQKGVFELLGYTPDEFTFDLIVDYFHPDDREMVKRLISAATNFAVDNDVSRNTSFMLTYRVKKKNGKYLSVMRQSASHELDEQGRLISSFAVISDISFMNNSNHVTWRFDAPGVDKEKFRKYVSLSYKGFFSERETEILLLMKQGNTSEQISKELFLSKHTIDTHRRNMLKKSSCPGTIELLNFCVQNKLI